MTEQLNIRLPQKLLDDLKEVSKYEAVKIPELVRSWIRERLREYEGNRRFEKWRTEKA